MRCSLPSAVATRRCLNVAEPGRRIPTDTGVAGVHRAEWPVTLWRAPPRTLSCLGPDRFLSLVRLPSSHTAVDECDDGTMRIEEEDGDIVRMAPLDIDETATQPAAPGPNLNAPALACCKVNDVWEIVRSGAHVAITGEEHHSLGPVLVLGILHTTRYGRMERLIDEHLPFDGVSCRVRRVSM